MPTPATKNSLAHHDLLALMAMGFDAAKSVVLDEPPPVKPLDPAAYWEAVIALMRAVGPIEPCRVPANDAPPKPEPVEPPAQMRKATPRARHTRAERAAAVSSSGDDEPDEPIAIALQALGRDIIQAARIIAAAMHAAPAPSAVVDESAHDVTDVTNNGTKSLRLLLDREGMAHALNVSLSKLDRDRAEEDFPELMAGDDPRFDPHEVLAWWHQHKRKNKRKKGKT